jgi:2-oxopent-4-enoate/cis-2-oxohex-4-enoate hydratase
MNESVIAEVGGKLWRALKEGTVIDPLTDRFPEISVDDAYNVQKVVIQHELDAGARIIGKKIGVTSEAVMQLLNVHQPDFGYLLDTMLRDEGAAIDTSKLIQPKAEGEIAFVLKSDLMGPGVSVADVLRATEGVIVCFEIVDSRIRDWKIRIQDTVADNASCGLFVLGSQLVDPRSIDLRTCGMVLEKNGAVVATGAGAAALNSPVNAVAWLANTLGRLGVPLKAGEVILSGSLATMVPVKAGDNLHVSIGGVGNCSVRFV